MIHQQDPWNVYLPIRSPELRNYVTQTSHDSSLNCSTSHVTNIQCHMTYEPDQSIDDSFNENSNFESFQQITYTTNGNDSTVRKRPSILVDKGLTNVGIKIYFGSPISFWLTKLLLMDVMKMYSRLKLVRFDRRRWVLIDIDDIFVAPEGRKMNKEDVHVCY